MNESNINWFVVYRIFHENCESDGKVISGEIIMIANSNELSSFFEQYFLSNVNLDEIVSYRVQKLKPDGTKEWVDQNELANLFDSKIFNEIFWY